jgi:hypothetical protein
MALQLNFTTNQGFQCSAAYARIDRFSGNKNFTQVDVVVYKDVQARMADLQPVAYFSISLPLTDAGSMADMYTTLKQDSNFTGAIDC